MTKYVSVIGNGESRRGFDITPLKNVTTMVGCNALFRDHNLEYVVACDRHMCQEAANTVGKNTTIYTRENGTNSLHIGQMLNAFLPYHTKVIKGKTIHSIGVPDNLRLW